jgi:hypothetical protein
VRRARPLWLGAEFVPHQRMNARIRQRHLVFFGQPDANVVVVGQAPLVLEFVLECPQGRLRHTAVDGRRGALVAEGLLQASRRVGIKPCGQAVALHASQGSNVLAMPGVPTRRQIQRVQSLAFLAVFFSLHAPLQLRGAVGNCWHGFSHLAPPPLMWE